MAEQNIVENRAKTKKERKKEKSPTNLYSTNPEITALNF